MKVLSIVSNRYASFYQSQTEAIESQSVNIEHIYPRKQTADTEEKQKLTRTRMDYIAMYRDIWRESLKSYDLIHANNGTVLPFALAQPKRPLVVTLWGSDLMGNSNWPTRHLAGLADHVIVPSKKMLEYLDCDATVIPFGVDTNVFYPMSKEKARERIGWDKEKKIVLFPASPNRPVKNFELAKAVVESLSSDVELRVLTGVPYERVPYYMNASDAVLLTSRRESGPMVVKEAALCNVPVVSTDVGFCSEVLSDISNSEVGTSKSDLVKELNIVLSTSERSDGWKHSDEWSQNRMAEEIITVYNSVTGHN